MDKKPQHVNLYDFDHTIYRGDASLDFILFELKRQPLLAKYLPFQIVSALLFKAGKKTRKQFKESAFVFLKDIKNIDVEVTKFWELHSHKIEKWYQAKNKNTDIIISASPDFLLKPITDKLNVGALIATIMDKKTGKISGENCRGEEKVKRLNQHNKNLSVNECYSDSISDLPMLKLSRHPFIVKKGRIQELQS